MLPENVKVGQAIADGNCFFDSFRQVLKQELGIEITIEQLRQYCKEFAQNNPPDWFINTIANNHDNYGVVTKETPDDYIETILNSNRWGDPDVEGRILCDKYRVKLHVIEKHNDVDGKEIQTDQIIDSEGSKCVNNTNYNEENTIHIMNKGSAHFEPILRTQEVRSHSDFPLYDYDNGVKHQLEKLHISSPDHQPMEVDPNTTNRKRFHSGGDEKNVVQSGRSRIDILEKSLKYPASGLKNTLHGNVYQLKLLMLFLKRGLDKEYSFRLATEMDAAEKFDDLVFQYENERKDGIVYRFLQAKHKQDESKKITSNDLLTEKDGEFSLQKYFISYRKIKQNRKFKGKNDKLKDFIICTNIDIDDKLQNVFEKVENVDNILDIQYGSRESKRLKLKIDIFSDKEKIFSILKSTSDLNRLAKKLAECIIEEKSINLKDPLFRSYHNALKENRIVDIENKKLHSDFIDDTNLSQVVTEFREIIQKIIKKPLQENINIWNEVKDKKLKLSDSFGKVFQLNTNPQITNANKFSKVITNLISQQGKVISIKREVTKTGIIKDNIDMLAGHVLIFYGEDKNKKIKFSSAFLDAGDKSLPGNLQDFKNIFKAELNSKNINFDQLGQYEFKINEFKTCEDGQQHLQNTLPNDVVTDVDIRKFFEELVFAVNQPNEIQLGKIIRNEMGAEFNNIDRKHIYSRFLEKMLDWMKEKEGKFFSHEEGKSFFEKIKKEILGEIWFDVRNPVELFTGRSEELKRLHDALQSGNSQVVILTAISGLGGIGKSELARKYAYEYRKEYDNNVIWINAEKYETMIDSFLKLARDNRVGISTIDKDGIAKSIESIVEEIYRFFAKRKSLFIFDDAEKYRAEKDKDNDDGIDKFLSLTSDTNKPHFIITSRNQKWKGCVETVVLLGIFAESESIEFIKKSLRITNDLQDQEIKELAEELQNFPLALQQAVAYIMEEDENSKNLSKEGKFDISDYLEKYKEKTKELLNFSFPEDSNNPYTKTTFITWRMTLEKIKNNENGKIALDILDIMAYFAQNNIPVEVFSGLMSKEKKELPSSSLLLLNKYSMIGLEHGEANIHKLVQQVTMLQLKEQNKEMNVLRGALALLKEPVEEGESYTSSVYTYHAVSAWNHASVYDELVKEFSEFPCNIINKLRDGIRYEEAYLFGIKALEILKKILKPDHPNTLGTQHNMAFVLENQGKYKDALLAYQQVFDKSKVILGLDHPDTLMTQHNMASVLEQQGKYEEALLAFQEVFDKEKVILGLDHPNTLSTQHNMALVLGRQGKYEEALLAYQEVFDKEKVILGLDHPDTLLTQHNMASVLDKQGKYEEALLAYQEVFDKRKVILDLDHPNTLITQHNMATVLEQQGKYEEALLAYQEVFDKNKVILGHDHPFTLTTQHNMALVLGRQGKYEKALLAFQEVFDKRKVILGLDHPDTLMTQHNMASVLEQQGKYEEALLAFQEVFDKRKVILGLDHPSTLTSQHGMASVLDKQGKYEEALLAYQEVIVKEKVILDLDHPNTLSTQHNMALVLGRRGKYEEALLAFQEVFDKEKVILGLDHPNTLSTQHNMALVLDKQGKYEEALLAYQEVFDKKKVILGLDHPSTLTTQHNIALVLDKLE